VRLVPRLRDPRRACLLGVAVAFAGCATYTPEPITDEKVSDVLQPPDITVLRARATDLGVAVAAPLSLDWREGLTPDSAATLAVLLNPTLRAERDRRGLARAQVLQAGILPNPQIGFGMDFPYGANSSGEKIAYGLDVSWDVTDLIARDATVNAAKAAAAQVDLEVAWSEWQAAEAAKLAVYDLLALREQRALQGDATDRLRANVELLRRALDNREATLPELSAAEASLREAEIAIVETDGETQLQELRLKRALGLPPDESVELMQGLSLPPAPALPQQKDLLANLQRRRLDLVALRRGYESQEETLRAAVLSQFPRINLGFSQGRDSGDFYTLGFGVTVDLPLFDRNQGRIAIERATRRQLFDEYVDRVAQARADFADAAAAQRSIANRIAAVDAALPALERLVDVYRSAVQGGSVDVLSFRQAEVDLTNKRVERIQLRREQADQAIALELASGTYLPGPQTKEQAP